MHPHRPKLADHITAELQAAIAAGRWAEWLPQERQLARDLRVSRSTLRDALTRLRTQGLIQAVPSEGHRLVQKRKSPGASAPRRVSLLMPEDLPKLGPLTARWIDELRAQLAEHGESLHLVESRAAFSVHPANALERLLRHEASGCWILRLSTRPMQEWFARTGWPCVVAGTCFPGINLPFVDRDHHAVCRHAIGRLASAGHKRIVLLVGAAQKAGDVESETGFREGAIVTGLGDSAFILRLPKDTRGIDRAIGWLFATATVPTAILVTQPGIYLTAFSSLAHRRLRVPEDVSLVGCAHDSFLNHLVPQPTGYWLSPEVFAAQVLRLVVQVLEGRTTAPIGHLILPEFSKGASLRVISADSPIKR